MRRFAAAVLSVLGLLAFAGPAAAAYPDRNVTIVVPYPAGGPTDQLARLVAEKLSKKFGQNFIVENVTGGSTIVASNKVAKAEPDGYTLLLHNLQISANPTLFKTLPFDTLKDFKTVMMINRNPLVVVGRPGLAPNSLKELIALMKKERLKEALPGFGTTGHLTSRLFAQEEKLKFDEIPYRGGAPAVTDVLGDHVDFMIGTPQQMMPLVKAGKLKAYGVTQKGKMPEFPTVDSMADLLGPKFDIYYWQGMFAPSKTPDAVIKTLNAALNDVANDPKVLKQWHDTGVTAFPKEMRSPADGEKFLKTEIARWAK
jgi:tripartite-type tricarboxylate transporter receptor subunit TctC